MIFVYDKNKTDKLLSDKVSITQDVQDNGKYLGIENGKVVPKNITTPPQTELMIETTYANLVSLRDNGNLIPGQQYRITDYQTIINGDVTYNGSTITIFQSAGHQFDLIVTADSENTLNENARAIQHEGDTYFNGNRLESWRLKYQLDNNNYIYPIVDTTNSKGFIYYMEDEKNNKCAYDFKNIQTKVCKITAYSQNPVLVGQYASYWSSNGAVALPSGATIDINDYKWYYTFTEEDSYGLKDGSTVSSSFHGNNLGSIYRYKEKVFTNVIVSRGNYVNGNNFYIFARNIIKCHSCYQNQGINFYNNVVGDDGSTNSDFAQNTFGPQCHNNTFGNNFLDNSFEANCYNNTFKGENQVIKLGNNCYGNIFGIKSKFDILMGNNHNNTFADNTTAAGNVTLSLGSSSNTFNQNVGPIFIAKYKANTTFTTAQNNTVITS